MTRRIVDSAVDEPAAGPQPAAGASAIGLAASALALQRTAGNAAVASLARAGGHGLRERTLARCGAGGCTCGGTCGERAEDEAVVSAGWAALRGAVAARSAGGGPAQPAPRPLQRKLKVRSPATKIPNPSGTGVDQTNAETIAGYLQILCPDGAPKVDGATGAVALGSPFCDPFTVTLPIAGWPTVTVPPLVGMSTKKVSCGCLCDMVASKHEWTIVVDDANWPHTVFDNDADAETPGVGSGGEVTAPSPNGDKLWGAGTVSGGELDIAPWLVLGHELCGHGWLGNRGDHGPDHAQPRGEGGHQETVKRENLIRAEHGIELRGGFKDPNCGESYWRDKAKPGTVNWSSYRKICEKWRAEYNKKHKTKYTITDKIP